MRSYDLFRRAASVGLAVLTGAALVACGGGGGGGTPAPPPDSGFGTSTGKAPGVTYTAFTLDEVVSAPLLFDVDGGIKIEAFTYTLSSNATSCGLSSNPNDPTTPVCSPMAGGEALLLCDNTTGNNFDTVLFKSSVTEAPISELRGLTGSSVTCGSPGVRNAQWVVAVGADGTVSTGIGAPGNQNFSLPFLDQIASPGGVQFFDWQFRFAVRKIVQGNKTTYFLMELYEKRYAGANGVRAPVIYVLEKTI